jgi:ATP-binding cassette subfamily B protein
MNPPAPAAPRPRIIALWSVLGPEAPAYIAAMACIALASALAYGTPLAVQLAIDVFAGDAVQDRSPPAAAVRSWLGGDAVVTQPWRIATFAAVTALLAGALTWAKGALAARASQRAVRRLRERVHAHLTRLPLGFFDRHSSGDLVQRCTSDVDTVLAFLSGQVTEIGRATALLLAAVPLMLLTDASLALWSLLLLPAVIGYGLVFFRIVRSRFLKKDEAEGALTARAQENLSGIRVVRAFGRGDFEAARFRDANDLHRRLDERLFRAFAIFWASSDVLCIAQLGLVFGIGLWRVSEGTMAPGQLAFFLVAVNLWLWPVRLMGRVIADLGKATVAFGRLQEVLNEPEDAEPAQPVAPAIRGAIDMRDVRFRHSPTSAWALDGLTFSVAEGETVAILGPSGAGKSTMIDVLLRLRDPESGSITVDGVPLERIPRATVRAAMVSVLQQPFLYSRSVDGNIQIARPGAPREDIESAAETASIHDSIRRFESGYATVVGERGITLSGGQRQRLAIARAVLVDAPVLVLDDSLSAVDTDTERKILDALRERRGRRTTIVVAHRLSTLQLADRVIVMERGRVIDSGTHAELVSRPGLYRRLHDLQRELEEAVS